MDMNLGKLREIGSGRPGVLHSMGPQRVRHNWTTGNNSNSRHVHTLVAPLPPYGYTSDIFQSSQT